MLDARGRVGAEGPLFDPAGGPTLVITTDAAPAAAVAAWGAAGAKVETVPAGPGGGVDLAAALDLLGGGREGFVQVLVEGGATLLGALLGGGHAQRLVVYVAPLLLGARGLPGFLLDGPPTLGAADRYRLAGVRPLGPDVRLDYVLAPEAA
ncbi:MAG: hypothetical protein KatS3mg009_2405 [Acidimicrobiia bacterium]|nr:MAG: hypothetical protein KatS3mg009_2405 [Acidimicrobiia bacterium]